MDPTPIPYDKFSEVRPDEVRQYVPGDKIVIYSRYCEYCEQSVGIYHIDECDAEACDDPVACPYSADWDGAACGYIVCPYCHRPATLAELKIEGSDIVESIADMVGLDEEVSYW